MQGLSETGYVEGKNVAIEYRWAKVNMINCGLAADLVHRQVAMIATSTPSLRSRPKTTTSLPFVFSIGRRPHQRRTCRQPQPTWRNITGATFLPICSLQNIRTAAPARSQRQRRAVLLNPKNLNVELEEK